MSILRLLWLLAIAASLPAQQAQNPSPMVEHTRRHPRLVETTLAGRREPVDGGTLWIPPKLEGKRTAALLVHFHGTPWVAEQAAAGRGGMAALTMQLGSGSAVYARAFADPERFRRIFAQAEERSGLKFTRLILSGWSAGHGAIRAILQQPAYYDRVDSVVLIDGLHTGYTNGHPGPLESAIDPENLAVFLRFARDAVAGRKQMVITHSEIFPGTFASTTETTDYLLRELQLSRRPVIRWGPMGTQQLSEVRTGRFLLLGYAGNSAPDHVDQLHSLPVYLGWLRK